MHKPKNVLKESFPIHVFCDSYTMTASLYDDLS